MNKDKIEELIAASKLNELLRKKEAEEDKKKSNVIILMILMTTSMMMTLKTILKMKKMTSRTN